MSKRAATPFDALLGMQTKLRPQSPSVTVVVCGKRVTDADQIAELVRDPEGDDLAALKARDLADHRRKAQKNATAVLWRERNKERMAELKAAWRAKQGKAALSAKYKAWYAKNRDEIRARRDARKAEALAQQDATS